MLGQSQHGSISLPGPEEAADRLPRPQAETNGSEGNSNLEIEVLKVSPILTEYKAGLLQADLPVCLTGSRIGGGINGTCWASGRICSRTCNRKTE